MTIIKVDARKPSAPNDLTEQGNSTPVAPSNLTEQNASTPANPVNLTEQAKSDPAAPSNLTEKAAVTPVNPIGLSELAKVDPVAPSNLSEIAKSDPVAPSNLTGVALSTPIAPSNLNEVARPSLNRTLSTLFNFNADLGLPDSMTYVRTSSASYVETYKGPLGRFQKRITNDYVGSVTNLALYSQDFDNAAWTTSADIILSKSNVKAPDGTQTAFKFDGNNSNFGSLGQTIPASSGTHTLSIFIKQGTSPTCTIRLEGTGLGGGADIFSTYIYNFNTDTFSKGTGAAGVYGITYEGGGWYKIWLTVTSTNITAARFYTEFDATSFGTVNIWGAQLTQSSIPLPYVRTFNVAVTQTFTANPRFEDKGLLMEGASTNLFEISQDFSDADWFKDRVTESTSNFLAPDGSVTASQITDVSGADLTHNLGNVEPYTSGTTYTFSVYLKAGSLSEVNLRVSNTTDLPMRASFDLAEGRVRTEGFINGTPNIEHITDGWYRCSVTATATANNSTNFLISPEKDGLVSYPADGTGSIHIWGGQLEANPFSTSYIRTEGAVATRAREEFNARLGLNDAQGSILIEGSYIGGADAGGANRNALVISDGTSNNRYVFLNVVNRAFGAFTSSGGSSVISTGGTVATDADTTSVLTFDNSSATLYENGVLDETDLTSSPLPQNINTITFNTNTVGGGLQMYGHLKRVEVYDLKLTASEVKSL